MKTLINIVLLFLLLRLEIVMSYLIFNEKEGYMYYFVGFVVVAYILSKRMFKEKS